MPGKVPAQCGRQAGLRGCGQGAGAFGARWAPAHLAAAVFGGFGFVFGFAGYNRMQEHLRPAQQLGGT